MKSNTPIIVRMLLNQFVMSIFGIMITLSTLAISEQFASLASCIPIFLYFFLIYHNLWDKGARDVLTAQRTGVSTPLKGFLYALYASIPTIVLTAVFSVITKEMTYTSYFADVAYTAAKLILTFCFQGMYHGIALIFSYHFVFYILAIFPAIIVGGLAYAMGYRNIRIIPENKKD
ncbi:MAG: hypothetical protein E7588_01460 [Ruminococcaceae bacterium]|nr:hypothetical protein [Oscillospiraceae bacterium]